MSAPQRTPIHILVAESDQTERDRLLEDLNRSGDADIIVSGDVETGVDCILNARAQRPEVILAAEDLAGIPGVDIARRLRQEMPWIAIIVLTNDDDRGSSEVTLDAMAAVGIYVLPKHGSPQELMRRIKQLGQDARTHRAAIESAARNSGDAHGGAQVVVVYGPKGGVGRTLIAAKLAYLLAGAQHGEPAPRVALCELGVTFSDLPALLDMRALRTAAELAKIYDSFTEQDALAVLQEFPGPDRRNLRVLFSPRFEQTQLEEKHVTGILLGLRLSYDYIVVDTGAGFTRVTQAILRNASRLVLVTTPDLLGLDNTKIVYRYVQRMGQATDLVINRFHPIFKISDRQIADYIGFSRDGQAPITILDQPQSVRLAVDTGDILRTSDKSLDFSRALTQLHKRLREALPVATPVTTATR